MKRLINFLSVCFLLILSACGPTHNETVAYNDSIINIIDNLNIEHAMLLDQIDGHNIDSLKITKKLFSEKAKTSLQRSEKIMPFAEKKEFC